LAPAAGTHFFAVDDGGVLFCEPAQRFYDLNTTAALCWLAISEGLPESAIIDELVAAGAPSGEARSWWEQSRAMFAAEGILAGAAAPARDEKDRRHWNFPGSSVAKLPISLECFRTIPYTRRAAGTTSRPVQFLRESSKLRSNV